MSIGELYKLGLNIRNKSHQKQQFILKLNDPSFLQKNLKEKLALASFLVYSRNKAEKSPIPLQYLKEIYGKSNLEKMSLHIENRIKCIFYLFYFFRKEQIEAMDYIEAPFTFYQEKKIKSSDVYCHSSMLSGLIWKKKGDFYTFFILLVDFKLSFFFFYSQ